MEPCRRRLAAALRVVQQRRLAARSCPARRPSAGAHACAVRCVRSPSRPCSARGVAQLVQHALQLGHALLRLVHAPVARRLARLVRQLVQSRLAGAARWDRTAFPRCCAAPPRASACRWCWIACSSSCSRLSSSSRLASFGSRSPGPARHWRPAAPRPGRARCGRSGLPPCAARAATCAAAPGRSASARLVEFQQVIDRAEIDVGAEIAAERLGGRQQAIQPAHRGVAILRMQAQPRARRRSARGRPGCGMAAPAGRTRRPAVAGLAAAHRARPAGRSPAARPRDAPSGPAG